MMCPPRHGFTLIEVLVSVTIVAVLAAAAGFVGTKAIESSRISRSRQNLRQLATANINYLADHGRYCPADDKWNRRRWHGKRGSASEGFDPTEGFLSPYFGEARELTPCPLLDAMLSGEESFESGTGGYGYNAVYVGGQPKLRWDEDGKRVSARMAQVLRPGSTVMFTTTAYARSGGLQEYPYCEPPFWDFGNGPSGYRPSPTVHFRARGKALVAWCDGRVTAEPPQDRAEGANPHGGKAEEHQLGWFGPDEMNGFWNPGPERVAGE